MRKASMFWKTLGLVGSQTFLAGLSGGCLPDNLLAETAGEIVSGLILTGVNAFLAQGAGLAPGF